jgi:hypothetical protein
LKACSTKFTTHSLPVATKRVHAGKDWRTQYGSGGLARDRNQCGGHNGDAVTQRLPFDSVRSPGGHRRRSSWRRVSQQLSIFTIFAQPTVCTPIIPCLAYAYQRLPSCDWRSRCNGGVGYNGSYIDRYCAVHVLVIRLWRRYKERNSTSMLRPKCLNLFLIARFVFLMVCFVFPIARFGPLCPFARV